MCKIAESREIDGSCNRLLYNSGQTALIIGCIVMQSQGGLHLPQNRGANPHAIITIHPGSRHCLPGALYTNTSEYWEDHLSSDVSGSPVSRR